MNDECLTFEASGGRECSNASACGSLVQVSLRARSHSGTCSAWCARWSRQCEHCSRPASQRHRRAGDRVSQRCGSCCRESGQARQSPSWRLDTELDPMLGDLSWDPLDRLVQGAAGNGPELPKLASDHLDRMARNLPDGVDFVELGLHDSGTSARIYRCAPDDVAVGTDELLTISGRLVSVDFRAGAARIEIPAILKRNIGTQLLVLRFPDELASDSDMQRCARQHVAAHGLATKTAAGIVVSLAVRWIQAVIDDRPGLWAPKRFTWPSAEERLDNVDMDEFLRTSRDDGEDDV